MNTRPRMLDWRVDQYGIQTYADWQGEGRGWLTTPRHCPECGHTWQAVAAIGSLGIECPACGRCELGYVWEDPDETGDTPS